MKLNILKSDGSKGSMSVSDSVFGITPNETVVHQAVNAEMANSRQGTHASKNRALVRGGGRKPFKQKGRGAARAGTTRSPIWRGGGTVFGPQPHEYTIRLPKKIKSLARRSVLSQKTLDKKLIVVESLTVEKAKTREFVKLLKNVNLIGQKVTVLVSAVDDALFLAARNLPNIYIVAATSASAYDLLDCDTILAEKAGLALLNEQLMVKN